MQHPDSARWRTPGITKALTLVSAFFVAHAAHAQALQSPPAGPPKPCTTVIFKPPASGDLAWALLEHGERGKKFRLTAKQTFPEFDDYMTTFGLRTKLATLPVGADRTGIERTGFYVLNNAPVAAQMAQGATELRWTSDPQTIRVVAHMVQTLTEPTAHERTLKDIAAKVTAAEGRLESMPPRTRAFARWVVRGYAHADAVAVDAAYAGYCMTRPSKSDDTLLVQVVETARWRGN